MVLVDCRKDELIGEARSRKYFFHYSLYCLSRGSTCCVSLSLLYLSCYELLILEGSAIPILFIHPQKIIGRYRSFLKKIDRYPLFLLKVLPMPILLSGKMCQERSFFKEGSVFFKQADGSANPSANESGIQLFIEHRKKLFTSDVIASK